MEGVVPHVPRDGLHNTAPRGRRQQTQYQEVTGEAPLGRLLPLASPRRVFVERRLNLHIPELCIVFLILPSVL